MVNLPLLGRHYFTWFVSIAGVSGTRVLIGLAHETRLTSRFIGIFVTGLPPRWLRIIMDLLDRYTNKDGLLARLATVQRAEKLDATALAAAVKQKVVGQDVVADEVAATLRQRLAQVARDKPVGVFLFVGPPGVGKTEMGKQLAHHLKRGFLFEDMSTCNNPPAPSGCLAFRQATRAQTGTARSQEACGIRPPRSCSSTRSRRRIPTSRSGF
jgi:ATPase family protein associated with various cellular activities (AAA)